MELIVSLCTCACRIGAYRENEVYAEIKRQNTKTSPEIKDSKKKNNWK